MAELLGNFFLAGPMGMGGMEGEGLPPPWRHRARVETRGGGYLVDRAARGEEGGKGRSEKSLVKSVVPEEGLEPSRPCGQRILSPPLEET